MPTNSTALLSPRHLAATAPACCTAAPLQSTTCIAPSAPAHSARTITPALTRRTFTNSQEELTSYVLSYTAPPTTSASYLDAFVNFVIFCVSQRFLLIIASRSLSRAAQSRAQRFASAVNFSLALGILPANHVTGCCHLIA